MAQDFIHRRTQRVTWSPMTKRKMKLATRNNPSSTHKPQQIASVRMVVLVLVSFLAGVAATAFWFHRAGNSNSVNAVSRIPDESAVGLPAAPAPTPPPMASPPPVDPAVIEAVKQSVPNYAAISLEDGENILRTAALKDFAAAAKEMDEQVAAAQQKLQDSQGGQSADDQQAALKLLQDTQAAQAEKLKEVSARLQAQIAALKSLKNPQ
jgi:hypothetical protein